MLFMVYILGANRPPGPVLERIDGAVKIEDGCRTPALAFCMLAGLLLIQPIQIR